MRLVGIEFGQHRRQTIIQLDRYHPSRRLRQLCRERARPWPNLNHHRILRQFRRVHNPGQDIRIREIVLAQPFAREQAEGAELGKEGSGCAEWQFRCAGVRVCG